MASARWLALPAFLNLDMATAVLPEMAAQVFDAEQALLVKLVYWLQTAAEAAGGSNGTMLLPSMSANANDSRHSLLVKAVYWAKEIADNGVSGGGFTFTSAAGEPPVDGSITTQGYIDTGTSIKWINVNWPDTASPDWQQF